MAAPNIGELVTMEMASRTRQLADNVTNNTALLNRLSARGNREPVTGGYEIRQELEYDENETYKRFSGYEVVDIQPSEVFDSAVFNLRQVAVAVTISRLEELQNAGKERMIPFLASRIRNAQKTMKNGLSSDLYSDGTASGGKQIDGIQAAVSTSPNTGTYGGINAATFDFWRNKATDINATVDNIKSSMMAMWVTLCRNMDKPDLICADNTFYRLYWESLQDQQRFTSPRMGRMGFTNLKFDSADVILDGGVGGSCPANRMYFINTEYMHWRPHADENMTPSRDRFATNQAALVKLILFAGNLTCSNRSLQGVLH